MGKRSAASNKKISSRRPTASNQKAQILALNAKVNANSRKLEGLRYKVQHSQRFGGIIGATVQQPYSHWSINRPSQMTQVFSAPNESAGGKYNYDRKGRFYMKYNITSGSEQSPLALSVFLIRPKNSKVAVSAGLNVAQNPGTSVLNLIQGVDYVNSLGLSMMNTKRWVLDAHWNITTSPIITAINQAGPAPAPTVNWQGDLHPIRKSFRGKNVLVLNNRTGLWSDTLDYAVNPNQRQFLVIFNNNQNQDQSPNIAGQCLWTAYTSE